MLPDLGAMSGAPTMPIAINDVLFKNNPYPMEARYIVGIISLLTIAFLLPGCEEEKDIKPTESTITLANNSHTTVEVEIDGVEYKLDANEEKIFTGKPDQSFSGEAVTFGETTSGSQVGGRLTWTIDDEFPASGNRNINFDVESDLFFLEVINNSEFTITQVYVNFELQSQTLDNVSIPNDGKTYNIGYYRAYSNSNVRLGTDLGYWHQPTLDLPFSKNQKYTFTAN
jgi:hypothetical protein